MLHPRLASRTLISLLLLCGACTDDGGSEGADETAGETGGPPDEPLFFPPGAKLIPAGDVWRGCLDGDGACDDDESPGGYVHVSTFFMDRYEATARSYDLCVDDGACVATMDHPDCNLSQGRFDFPINCLSYDMAVSYCEWRGMRLPTEAEWERAARGSELTLYPWGDDTVDCTRGGVDECTNSTLAGGTFPEGDSPFGIHDMVGNVSEWVADFYDDGYYADSKGEDDPQGPASGSSHVIKGSAFTVPAAFPAQRISKRNFATPETAIRIYGVRCARDR